MLDVASPPRAVHDPHSAYLVVIYGDELGRRLPLGIQATTYGREPDCDVQLDDERVSRRHAQVLWTGQGFLVKDLGSTNGTFINNAAVEQSPLNHGDQLKIGRSIFKLIYGDSAEAQYHEVIYQLMTQDGLTGAQNKRSFEETLGREISRALRYERPLALILFDIDHFKTINDEHGHMAGDEVLRQLGALVQQSVRREDVFGRIGGEEFALLVPEGASDGAELLAERLRAAIERSSFPFESLVIRVTCSFGVSTLAPGDESPEQMGAAMMKNADRRLYAAKGSGRNRVVSEG
jgi:diguanylate cyclase (GGDEF)-like protein